MRAALPSQLSPRTVARLSPLPRSFYLRDPRTVARELLGKLLISRVQRTEEETELLAGRIVEAEAYLGTDDPGAHSYRGPTARNAVLFGPPGHAYVYFIYGNHYCMNVSCEPAGRAGCVLLRALEPVCGIESMAELRGLAAAPGVAASGKDAKAEQLSLVQLRRLTSGPGRLANALGITRPRHNGCDLCARSSGLYIAAPPHASAEAVSTTTRINVTRAPHEEYRFLLTGNPFVSAKRA
jgi:DNA-3-methyladenine glycosylase